MNNNDLHGFSSDRPINAKEEDSLGRSQFSIDLANTLANWHGKDSLVVALHGDWGSGKSSVKNMVVEHLQKNEKNKPDIIEFSPWEWAAQEKIYTSFFEEISKAIGRKDKNKSNNKLALTFRKYGHLLNVGGAAFSGASTILRLFSIITLIGFSGTFIDSVWTNHLNTIVIIFIVLILLATFFQHGKNFLDWLSRYFEANAKQNEQSLEEIRLELTKLLSEKNTPLIVVLDDVDRLTSPQLGMIFQLIKVNLEFPNIVFFVLFDRNIIEKKLTDETQNGREFLEKIIQVPINIPQADISQIHNILFNKIEQIVSQDNSAQKMFDREQFDYLFHFSLYKFFDNLRDVYRYTSTLSFHFQILKGKSVFEVNPVDLIAIECLRVFEPNVYNEIARSKYIFTISSSGSHKDISSYMTEIFNNILAKASSKNRETVKKMLSILFPNLSALLDGMEVSINFGNTTDTWLREMRICHHSVFDKYFKFTLPATELSNSELQKMFSLTADSNEFSSYLLSLQNRGVLNRALWQFNSFTDDIPLGNGFSYIKAILDVADQFDNKLTKHIDINSYQQSQSLVNNFLLRIENIEERSKLLLNCFRASNGKSIIGHILLRDEKLKTESNPIQILHDEEFRQLKEEFLRKIYNMFESASDELFSSKHLISFLNKTKRWGDDTKVKNWIKVQTETPAGCIDLLKQFVIDSRSNSFGHKKNEIGMRLLGPEMHQFIKLSDIEKLIEISSLEEKIKEIDEKQLDSEQKQALVLFNQAIEDRKNGKINDWERF